MLAAGIPAAKSDGASEAAEDVVKRAIYHGPEGRAMIRKLPSGQYRLYSRKKNPETGKRRNLGTFDTRQAAEKHERAVQYFKRR